MYQIKIFRFRINNRTCSDIEDERNTSWFVKEKEQLYSIEEMEFVLNKFLESNDIVDITMAVVTCRKNEDRMRDDDVDLVYSITYKTQPSRNIIPEQKVVEQHIPVQQISKKVRTNSNYYAIGDKNE